MTTEELARIIERNSKYNNIEIEDCKTYVIIHTDSPEPLPRLEGYLYRFIDSPLFSFQRWSNTIDYMVILTIDELKEKIGV